MADWLDHDPPALDLNPTPLYVVVTDPKGGVDLVEPWVEQEAQLALHRPWCGVHFSESGVCTEGCRRSDA
jgi:hypothetical protein